MYSCFKRTLLFAFFIVAILQITSFSSFAMEDDYINNNSHIKKNNLENNEQSQLVNNKQKHIFTCLSDCLEGCYCENTCGIWVHNIGIYAYNMFAGVCGPDGCYFCKTVEPVYPCFSISEACGGNCNNEDDYNRKCAKDNVYCCKIICCPLDTACHLSCLPLRLCGCCCCEFCCDESCDFDSTPKKVSPQQSGGGNRTYVPETHTYYTNKGYVESKWVDMNNPEERKKMHEGTHSSIIKN